MDQDARRKFRDQQLELEKARLARVTPHDKIQSALDRVVREQQARSPPSMFPVWVPSEEWVAAPPSLHEGTPFPPFKGEGRPKLKTGPRSFEDLDRPLAEELNRRVQAGETQWVVAEQLAERAAGHGHPTSKAKRIAKLSRKIR